MKTAENPGMLPGMGKGLRRVLLAILALAWLPSRARAEDFTLYPSAVPAAHFFTPPEENSGPRFRLTSFQVYAAPTAREGSPADPPLAFPPALPSSTEAPPLFSRPTLMVTGVTLVGATLYGLSAGWAHGFNEYHWGDEGWFGLNSYGGGSDKASHFIVCNALARELAWVYDRQGHTRAQSTALAFGITTLSGLIVEISDGFTPYGFGWQDLVMDVLGGATGLLITRNGLDDLLGFRLGKVPTGIPDGELDEREPFLGTAYSSEVYSADLKIAGLSKRMRFDPGPARFLMTSVTYSTKGYGYVPPVPDRQRLIGFELGLNVPEILRAVGVTETTWWGTFLLKAFNFFRIPFTSFGFRYDLNSHTWHGPDTGNIFYSDVH